MRKQTGSSEPTNSDILLAVQGIAQQVKTTNIRLEETNQGLALTNKRVDQNTHELQLNGKRFEETTRSINKKLDEHIDESKIIHLDIVKAMQDMDRNLRQEMDNLRRELKNDFFASQDLILTKLTKLEEDHYAIIEWLKRHDAKLAKHDIQIRSIQLKVAV